MDELLELEGIEIPEEQVKWIVLMLGRHIEEAGFMPMGCNYEDIFNINEIIKDFNEIKRVLNEKLNLTVTEEYIWKLYKEFYYTFTDNAYDEL